MNAEEALQLCRLAKTISPAQAVDEYTPAAWALILEDVRYVDARQALKQLGGEQEWIHVSHIVKRVKKLRGERVTKYAANVSPPSGLSDAEYAAWHRRTIESIADGDLEPEPQVPAGVTRKRDVLALGSGPPSLDAAEPARNARDAHAEAKRVLQEAAVERNAEREKRREARENARRLDREARAQADQEPA